MSDDFEKLFGCTYEQHVARQRDRLKAALRGEKCVNAERERAAKDLFDFVRKDSYLCDAILFELERSDAEKTDWEVAWELRASRRRLTG